jgi:hypothetical protein
MAYKVHVTKGIWSNEERTELFDDLYRDIELPFIPFIGLELQQDGWWCGPIDRLKWDGDRQLFVAESRDAAPDPDLDFPKTAEEMRDSDMKNYGWQSHKKKV